MNECGQSERVSAYHDGELPSCDRREMERHIGQCPQCSAELNGLRKLSVWMASSPIPAPSPEVLAGLHRKVDQIAVAGVYRMIRACAAVAAAVLIVCTIGLTRQGSSPAATAAPVWEAQAAAGQNVELVLGGTEEVLAGWTVQDLSGKGGHE